MLLIVIPMLKIKGDDPFSHAGGKHGTNTNNTNTNEVEENNHNTNNETTLNDNAKFWLGPNKDNFSVVSIRISIIS